MHRFLPTVPELELTDSSEESLESQDEIVDFLEAVDLTTPRVRQRRIDHLPPANEPTFVHFDKDLQSYFAEYLDVARPAMAIQRSFIIDHPTKSRLARIKLGRLKRGQDVALGRHTYFGNAKDFEFWWVGEVSMRVPHPEEMRPTPPKGGYYTERQAKMVGSRLLDFALARMQRFAGWVVLVSDQTDFRFCSGSDVAHRQILFQNGLKLMEHFGWPLAAWDFISRWLSEKYASSLAITTCFPPILRSVVGFGFDFWEQHGLDGPGCILLDIEACKRTDGSGWIDPETPLAFVYIHTADQIPFLITPGLTKLQIEGLHVMGCQSELAPGSWVRSFAPWHTNLLDDCRGSTVQLYCKPMDDYFHNSSWRFGRYNLDFVPETDMVLQALLDVAVSLIPLHHHGLVFQDFRLENLGFQKDLHTGEVVFYMKHGSYMSTSGHKARVTIAGGMDLRNQFESYFPPHDIFGLGLLGLRLAWAISPYREKNLQRIPTSLLEHWAHYDMQFGREWKDEGLAVLSAFYVQVYEWLDQLLHMHPTATWLHPLLSEMLAFDPHQDSTYSMAEPTEAISHNGIENGGLGHANSLPSL
ncbi:MAG: uncharacterized protein KVP18_002251 [Porospora cf. gigantea A]|uniref:uncharacterized protein n=1 Tax=Porospora cf. gigantea A TaxID=2853593 RepID=UPI00355945EC|nr:MAG: hypothetical protein KVP18_002251 [Porospora cf. gigantea A]